MSRDLSALFVEETAKEEQCPLVHLITVAIEAASAAGLLDSLDKTKLLLDYVPNLLTGQVITLDNHQETVVRKVVSLVGRVLTLDIPLTGSPDRYTIEYSTILNMVDLNYNVTFGGAEYLAFPVKFGDMSVSADGSVDKTSISIANVSREITYYLEKYDGLRNRPVSCKVTYEKFLDFRYLLKHEAGEYRPTELYIKGDVVSYQGNRYVCLQEGTYPTFTGSPPWFMLEEAIESIVQPVSNPEADPNSCVEDSFIVDSYSYDENVCVLQLDPALDLGIKLPRRKYFNDSCSWTYRDRNTCGYSGPDPDGETLCFKTLFSCRKRGNTANFGGFPGTTGNRRIFF